MRDKNGSGPERQPLRFAFLTDLHSVCIGDHNGTLLAAVRRAEPDAVLCGGDMIVGKPGQTPETALALLRRLREEYPVIHALGNHEYRAKIYPEIYGKLYREYTEELLKLGVTLLDNGRCSLTLHGRKVTVYGLSISREYYQRFARRSLPVQALTGLLGNPDPDSFSILLAHNPEHMDAYFSWGADLTLCGHYHGGILRFGEHRGLVSPDFRLFPREAHGLFERGAGRVIVGAGLGEHTLPLRLHNPRELVTITV